MTLPCRRGETTLRVSQLVWSLMRRGFVLVGEGVVILLEHYVFAGLR